MKLIDEITELISKGVEGPYWDFKLKYSDDRKDLLKDIICMANNLEDRDAYIIFGVKDNYDSIEVVGIDNENRMNRNELRQLLKDVKFSSGIRPQVSLDTLEIDNKSIDVITIINSSHTPYFLTEDVTSEKRKVIWAHHIYTRVNDSNTDSNRSADINHIEYLWRKRFGILKSPLERLHIFLHDYENWFIDLGNKRYAYYKLLPEYRIDFEEPEPAYETPRHFYLNSDMNHGKLYVKFHSTTLFETEYWTLDGFGVYVPQPKLSYVQIGDDTYVYYYFLLDSLEGKLLYLFTKGENNYYSRVPGFENKHFLLFQNVSEAKDFNCFYNENFKRVFDQVKNDKSQYHLLKSYDENTKDRIFGVLLSIAAYKLWIDV